MKKVRILSIDGGGMRGIIPATVLSYVEKQLIEKTNNPNARLADFFDLIVGTSTGGILSAFCLAPSSDSNSLKPISKFTAQDALSFYLEKGNEIFNQSRRRNWLGIGYFFNAAKYNPKKIEHVFKTIFGNLKMKDLLKPCLLTTYEMKTRRAFFFNSRESKKENRDFFLTDVLRSTSAAPTYFPPAKIRNIATNQWMYNIDGGVFANNPAMCAYAEARKLKRDKSKTITANDMLILSIGTGGGAFDLPAMNKSHRWGLINWAKAVPDIMMDGSIDTVHYQMKELFGTLPQDQQAQYLRIDFPDSMKKEYSRDMADASAENIEALRKAGQKTLHHSRSELDSFIKKLTNFN